MPQITKTTTTEAGYACDRCGKMISDGQHDGLGGINWWGMEVALRDCPEERLEITAHRTWMERVEFRVRVLEERNLSQPGPRWLLCKACGKLIEDHVRQMVGEGGKS